MIKSCVTVLCIAGFFLQGTEAVSWPELRGKFTLPIDIFHLTGFYLQPKTLDEALKDGWTVPPETLSDNITTLACRESDPALCIKYDAKYNIAGIQLSVPRKVDELDLGMNYTTKGFKPTILFGQELYSVLILLESQDMIQNGGRESDGNIGTGLWLPIGGEYVEIPLNEADIPTKTPDFIKQNCFGGMGQHYFYKANPNTTKEEFQPWFLLYDETHELHGFGMLVFGANIQKQSFWSKVGSFLHLPRSSRNWWESVPTSVVSEISPDHPQWILEYIEKFGTFSHHVYFKSKPWNISCP